MTSRPPMPSIDLSVFRNRLPGDFQRFLPRMAIRPCWHKKLIKSLLLELPGAFRRPEQS